MTNNCQPFARLCSSLLRKLALVTLLAGGLAASCAVSAQGVGSREQAMLLEKLSAEADAVGKVRVIVKLKVDALPAGSVGTAAAHDRSRRIRAAQDAAEVEIVDGVGARVAARYKHVPHMVMEVDRAGLARLRRSGAVQSISEDIQVSRTLIESTEFVKAPAVWAAGYKGVGQAVAILDDGVDRNHPFFGGRVVSEACYSSSFTGYQSLCPGGVNSTAAGSAAPCANGCSHGTHVAGIAAGADGPGAMSGVAPGAKIIAIQVFSRSTSSGNLTSWSSDVLLGLERVYELSSTHKVAAVNMSLGSGRFTNTCDAYIPAVTDAINLLRSVGIATVVAAGNDGYLNALSWPACVSSAISVGSVSDGGSGISDFSNVTPWVSLMAPGEFIYASIPNGHYEYKIGTSMAAPHVAGAWALLKETRAGISVGDGLALLRSTAKNIRDTRPSGTATGLKQIDLTTLSEKVYKLTVGKSGNGSGTLTSAPSGINCGSACVKSFTEGTTITLTPTPGAGSLFSGWAGDCSGTGACTFTMSADRYVEAIFAGSEYQLTVTKTGGPGLVTSSAGGISCGSVCSGMLSAGTSVTLTATPGTGSSFLGWSGACSGTGSCTVTMSEARSVSAAFSVPNYTLSVAKTGTGSGVVSTTSGGINCGSTCSISRPAGSVMALTATPDSGSRFYGWVGGACSGTGVCTVTLDASTSVTARFVPATNYVLTVQKDGSGGGTVTSNVGGINCGSACTASLSASATVTLTAKANTGSRFLGWSGACAGTSTCTVSMSASRLVQATFTSTTYLLTAKKVGSGGGVVSTANGKINCGPVCRARYLEGLSIRLIAEPAPRSIFVGWSGACTGQTRGCLVHIDAAKTVEAKFLPRQLEMTMSVSGTGGGTIYTGSGTLDSDMKCGVAMGTCRKLMPTMQTLTITASPRDRSVFAGWGGACAGNTGLTCAVLMDEAKSVSAVFNRR